MIRSMTGLAGVMLVALSAGSAMAGMPAETRAALQQAVDRCGKAYGTLVKGQRPFAAGPFLHEVLSAADRAGASDPQRQNLRIDFNNAADRQERNVDTAPPELAAEVNWCIGWRG